MSCPRGTIAGCLECPSKRVCSQCKAGLGFVSEDAATCAIPLELGIQNTFKVIIVALLVIIMGSMMLKAWLVRVYSKKNKDKIEVGVLDAEDGKNWQRDAAAALNTSIKERTENAIRYGMEHARSCRNLDWTDPDAGVDAAYKAIADKSYRAMPFNESERPVPREYPMCINVHTKFIMGVGVPLFFNYHFLPLAAAVVLLVATGSATWESGLSAVRSALAAEDDPSDETLVDLAVAVEKYAQGMWMNLGIAYFVLLFLSFGVAVFQWRFAGIFNKYNSTMQDYTITMENLPESVFSEKKLEDLIVKHTGLQPVGASIALDAKQPGLDGEGTVGDMMYGMIERLVIDLDTKFEKKKVPELEQSYLFGYDDSLALKDDKEGFEKDKGRFRKLVDGDKLKGGGFAAVVFKSKADTNSALLKADSFEVDGVKIAYKRLKVEPTGIEWLNVGTKATDKKAREVKGSLKLFMVFALVCAGVYYPLNRLIMFPYSIEKSAPQPFTSQCIGIINGIVGGLLGPILFMTAGGIGYHFKSHFDRWCLGFCVVNSAINFVFGNFCVMFRYVRHGLMAVEVGEALVWDDMEAELRLSDFYYRLLVPGMLFTGWIVGKVMGDMWPFVQHFLVSYLIFIAKCLPDKINVVLANLIPYNPRVIAADGITRVPLSAREAEYIWVPKIFSVAWEYPEKIWNPTICFMTLFVLSDQMWLLFAVLIVWLVSVYMYHRFVQFHAYAKYMNSLTELELQAQRLWCIPLSVLAGAWVMWGSRLGHFSWKVAFPLAVVLNVLVYQGVLTLIYRHFVTQSEREKEEDENYEIMARRLQYSWFNTNPGYVLKSRYAPELLGKAARHLSYKPLAPFFYGKEYLVLNDKGRA